MRRSNNPIAACAVAATVLAACTAEAPSPAWARTAPSLYAAGSDVAAPRPGVLLLHASPGSERILTRVGSRTEFGSPTRLAVVGESGDWLAVISSKLGNRTRGFVLRSDIRLTHVPFSVELDLSRRRLTVWRIGVSVRRIDVAIGTPSTPTPLGRFSVTDKLRVTSDDSPYGCCVLALNGHQTNLPEDWPGGDRLAVHATADVDSIGEPVSLGCMRVRSREAKWLIETIPLGAPIFIRP